MEFARHNQDIIAARDAAGRNLNHLTCPRCGLPVIWRQTRSGRSYFRHTLAHPSCGTQGETERHFIAKQIIIRAGYILGPDAEEYALRQMTTEQPLSRFYIDVAAFTPDRRRFLIEINHNHPATPDKIAYFQEQGFQALEIDLNDLHRHHSFADNVLRSAPRKWLSRGNEIMEPVNITDERFAVFSRRRREIPPFTRQNLEDFLHAVAQQYRDFPATRFTGTIQSQPHYFLKEFMPYCIRSTTGPALFDHMIGLRKTTFDCRKRDVGRPVTFTLESDTSRFIFSRPKGLPVFLPLADDITWQDET
ncbi:MAG: hypothetical protein ACE5D8_05085 [Fidelibacterota bacterium]